jgi:hypothetical protein
MSEGATRVGTHRLRRRYRELLHNEIERTITLDSTVEEELRLLFEIFST